MELKKLDSSFYIENPILHEALDFDRKSGTWMEGGKVRGHGIVQIAINGLIFAIPVRSNIDHDQCFILEVNRANPRIKGMGLDYSKAMLIRDEKHVTSDVFVLTNKAAAKKLIGKQEHITKSFSKYVERYVAAVAKKDKHILGDKGYRFTTLINFHRELGIDS
ncbi:type III toxin-antitoxin system TenpIN family toxin [Aeromonas hydrophila]|uniref:type III toxin-antitoxin system TenpIN family toxin n=1 Tax=Aeromonas hydrophila TaxID=644 RepID=UPI0039867176